MPERILFTSAGDVVAYITPAGLPSTKPSNANVYPHILNTFSDLFGLSYPIKASPGIVNPKTREGM